MYLIKMIYADQSRVIKSSEPKLKSWPLYLYK